MYNSNYCNNSILLWNQIYFSKRVFKRRRKDSPKKRELLKYNKIVVSTILALHDANQLIIYLFFSFW